MKINLAENMAHSPQLSQGKEVKLLQDKVS